MDTLFGLTTIIGSVFGSMLEWCSTAITTALAIPVVQFFIAVAVVGIVFGLAKSLLSVR